LVAFYSKSNRVSLSLFTVNPVALVAQTYPFCDVDLLRLVPEPMYAGSCYETASAGCSMYSDLPVPGATSRAPMKVRTPRGQVQCWQAVLAYGLWLHFFAVTVSSTGPGKLFKWMTTATSGVLARVPCLLPVRNSFASCGASVVTRTSGRGHVAEAKTNVIEVGLVLNQGFQRNPSHP